MHEVGLIVGKFSPLHSGHVHAIEEARRQCRELIILTYSNPEFEGCERERRERWLRRLFCDSRIIALNQESVPDQVLPLNSASDHEQREFVAWVLETLLCENRIGLLPDVVFTSESYGPGFARHLSDRFKKLVEHIAIDPSRSRYPVSASLIRADLHGQRHWLPPEVYRDFVQKVLFLGAESTGKSTLSRRMAHDFDSIAIEEFGRTLWEQKNGLLDFSDMLAIGCGQIEREEERLGRANRFLFCDTSPLSTVFYSEALFGRVDPRLMEHARRHYDQVFLCFPDFPLVQDGTRSDEAFRKRHHDWYIRELAERKIPYHELRGPLEDRVRETHAMIGKTSIHSEVVKLNNIE